MNAKVVCFLSSKGGAGKTVVSSSLATLAASLGKKTLIIDTDAATNGLTLLFMQQLLSEKQAKNLLSKNTIGLFDATDGVEPSKIKVLENLEMVPATFSMLDSENVDLHDFERSLKNLIASCSTYDFVLLDAQAGTDNFAKIAAGQAHDIVVVSEYDPVSVQGIERLKLIFSDILMPSSTWTLFNKILPEFATLIGEGLAVLKFLPPIPWDADVVRAFSKRDLAIDMSNPNPFTLSIAQLAYSLYSDRIGNEIENWSGMTYKNLTSPVEERLLAVQSALAETWSSNRRSELLKSTMLTTLSAVFLASAFFSLSKITNFTEIVKNIDASVVRIFTVLVLAFGAAAISMYNIYVSKRAKPSRVAHLLEMEESQLRASLASSRAITKRFGEAGKFERQRRYDEY